MAAKILIDAANYCHDLDILHRDIKLENILFKTSDHDLKFMKIAEFQRFYSLKTFRSEEKFSFRNLNFKNTLEKIFF